jgi:hypothetical protein
MRAARHDNFLDYVPRRLIKSTTGPDGSDILVINKFGRSGLGRWWASLIGRRAFVRIHLDGLGWGTWNAMDGRRTVGEIARIVSSSSGEDATSMYERCSRFVRTLVDAGAVGLSPPGTYP